YPISEDPKKDPIEEEPLEELKEEGETSKAKNTTVEMLHGLDQQKEKRKMVVYILLIEDRIPLIGDVRTITMDETHASSDWLTCLKVKAETSKTIRFATTAEDMNETIREDCKNEKLVRIYIDEIVARNRVPVSIISDCNGRFTSRFLADVAEIVRNVTKYEYNLSSSNGWIKKPLEFEVGDQVLLKVSPWKGVLRFEKKEKLAPRYVRPFEILERIGLVAYRLRLPQEMSGVHDTFHLSNLKKYLVDANLHVPIGDVKTDKTLRFIEELVEIMDREVKFG
nr:putative reverse transcriptase domain-containing protein [Tanacetum cinerariifolium]